MRCYSRVWSSLTHPKVAEKLYQQGFVSYPRTETDQFDPQFDFMSLIQKQTNDAQWGQFATQCVLSQLGCSDHH
jgi:DNA topoisomerase IA